MSVCVSFTFTISVSIFIYTLVGVVFQRRSSRWYATSMFFQLLLNLTLLVSTNSLSSHFHSLSMHFLIQKQAKNEGWFYIGQNEKCFGPFKSRKMREWFEGGSNRAVFADRLSRRPLRHHRTRKPFGGRKGPGVHHPSHRLYGRVV